MKKEALCKYVNGAADDSGIEALRLFLPVNDGYINYNIVHSVMKRSNCDTWRLSVVYHYDDLLSVATPLTRSGAEWEMALKIHERPDFIGGYAHGDEVFQKVEIFVDGEYREVQSLSDMTPFKELIFEVSSIGYDPIDSVTEVLLHHKKITVGAEGVKVEQRVEWLNDYTLGNSYMAMMPPLKTLTDSFYTNVDPTPKEPIANYGSVPVATEAVVFGASSGISFRMSVLRYPRLVGGNRFFMTDNHGCPYNKMYFVVCNGAAVSAGDVWESETRYTITVGEVLSQ
jgi:hypothetical protein